MTETYEPLADAAADQEAWEAVARRDAAWDGRIVYGVTSTGGYCRPSCP